MHTTQRTVSKDGGYIDHTITYANDYEEKMDALCQLTTMIITEAKKEYYSDSSFSILSHKKGCYVLNNMTSYLCFTEPLSWELAQSFRKSQLSSRRMKY